MKFTDSLFFNDKFWKLLNFIEGHPKQTCSSTEIAKELEIEEKEVLADEDMDHIDFRA